VRQIARMIGEGYRIVITHGDGPIVGNIVMQNEAARNTIPPMHSTSATPTRRGGIGFVIQQTLYKRPKSFHAVREVVTVITQVVVDGSDPVFEEPTKPIGPFYTMDEAKTLKREKGWKVIEDSGRGYSRVVPSPRPIRVIESAVIDELAASGVVVIALGGGGVPVIELDDGRLREVEAAIAFLEAGGREVVITSPELIEEAMAGRASGALFFKIFEPYAMEMWDTFDPVKIVTDETSGRWEFSKRTYFLGNYQVFSATNVTPPA